jgi:hypothetical protein
MDPPVAAAVKCSPATDAGGSGAVNDPMDIWFWRSTDGGASWEPPRRINDDPCHKKAWQWFGTMSIAPNGRLDVIWNDNRAYINDNPFDVKKSQLYYASSSDAGTTWSANLAISGCWINGCAHGVGEYYQMVSDDVGAHLAWAATFDGATRIYHMRINAFAQPLAAGACPSPP